MKILSYCRTILYTCAVLLCGLLRGALGRGLAFCLLFFVLSPVPYPSWLVFVTSCGCGCLLSCVDEDFPCFCALCTDLCAQRSVHSAQCTREEATTSTGRNKDQPRGMRNRRQNKERPKKQTPPNSTAQQSAKQHRTSVQYSTAVRKNLHRLRY